MNQDRLLFYDDRALLCRHGLHLAPTPVTKHGVVLDADRDSDLDSVSCFAGTVLQLDDGRFRMYYYSRSRETGLMRIAVAESEDGLHWHRPLLGQMTWEGKDTNHIRIEGLYDEANVTQPIVLHLPDGRWLMYCWLHGHDRGYIRYIISASPDGLRWKTIGIERPAVFHPADLEVGQAGWTAGLTAANPTDRFGDRRTLDWMEAKRLRSNDATNVYYDAELGLFEMLSVWLMPNKPETGRHTPHDNAPGVLRTIHRRTSPDGLTWSAPELIITPDEHDPPDQQFYYLSQHRAGEWRIGFLGNYPCWEQTMDIELCFSRDGREWLRPLRGGFVPRDPMPEQGCMSAYATNDLITIGDENCLLYRAGNVRHNQTLPPGVTKAWCGIMAATWPKGRFAGLATAPPTIGRLTFKPFLQTGPELGLDANVKGSLKAELRDPIGGPLPGYELHNCIPVSGDSRDHVLRWGEEGKTTAPFRYDAVSLRIEMSNGVIYSLRT